MDRVFLDANVLFSAAYRGDSSLLQLWALSDAVLLTSVYALDEAYRNLEASKQKIRLDALAIRMEISSAWEVDTLPAEVLLPEDDRPILAAAISAGASHLLSGDRRAFGRYYGARLSGVLVLRPSEYLLIRSSPELR